MDRRDNRAACATDTLARADEIVASTPGASLASEFLRNADLPKLKQKEKSLPWPNHPPSPILVVNSDSYTLARRLHNEQTEPKSKIAVLNLASDALPGGGWVRSLSRTQAS